MITAETVETSGVGLVPALLNYIQCRDVQDDIFPIPDPNTTTGLKDNL